MSNQNLPGYLTEKQVAARLNRSVKTLRGDRLRGTGIPFYKFGTSVRYREDDVLEFERLARRVSTSDPGAAPCNIRYMPMGALDHVTYPGVGDNQPVVRPSTNKEGIPNG